MALLAQLFGWTLNKNENEREHKVFYLKSLSFLVLIVIVVSEKCFKWNMIENIRDLLGDNIVGYMQRLTEISLHFFTALIAISMLVMIIAIILYLVVQKTSNNKLIDYLNRLRVGAEFRLKYSIEDVLIFLVLACFLDDSIVTEYQNTYSEALFGIVIFACGIIFFLSSLIGVLNRFFVLWSDIDINNKN